VTKPKKKDEKPTESKDLEAKTDTTSETEAKVTGEKIPEGLRKFTLSDVLLCLAEIRTDLDNRAIMSGIRSKGYSISLDEIKSGLISVPVKKDKA